MLQNKNIAVKKIFLNAHTIDDKLFDREVKNLMMMEIINHPNVVRFIGFCSNTHYELIEHTESGGWVMAQIRERLLCFDYISNGSLDKHITGMTVLHFTHYLPLLLYIFVFSITSNFHVRVYKLLEHTKHFIKMVIPFLKKQFSILV